jgi:uncharacterized protein YggE
MDKPSVSVRGTARLEVPPDLARFTVSVSSRHPDRQVALEALAERSSTVREIVDSAGAAVEKRESGGFHLWPETRRPGEGLPAYAGSVATTVTVNDFAVLGDLMVRLALVDQCHVAGPQFQLREHSGHLAEARRAAVQDGLERARQFADSLGAKLDSLVDLTDCDNGPMHDDVLPGPPPVPSVSGPTLPSFDVDLRPLTVQAEVQLRLTITPPVLTV